MDEFGKTIDETCPHCGEAVRENWKFCPACEAPLGFVCPQCQRPVKENWKRCPECEARIVCRSCGRRIQSGHADCEACSGGIKPTDPPEKSLIEPVTGIEFVAVPRGSFMMGDLFDEGLENEKPAHDVRLDRFYIGKYPVTQRQWHGLMPENNSRFQGDTLPVEQVTWDEVQIFIKRISEAVSSDYRVDLPTEAQWEYAARSGGRNETYAGSDTADPVAWYDENSSSTTHPVGMKAPNGLGLYDMCGNVWEWCRDNFKSDAYRHHKRENPAVVGPGRDRVIRGGGWNVDSWSVRCARRSNLPRELYGPGLGFRLVLTVRES